MQKVTIEKVRPDTVPYGSDIATGPWVYAAYDTDGRLLNVSATMKEAKRRNQWSKQFQRMMTQRRYNPGETC